MPTKNFILSQAVPISMFNEGFADKIFQSVRNEGLKVVVKNNAPECILLSPEMYQDMIEKIENSLDIALAEQRLKDPAAMKKRVPFERVLNRFKISQQDIDSASEVEFV